MTITNKFGCFFAESVGEISAGGRRNDEVIGRKIERFEGQWREETKRTDEMRSKRNKTKKGLTKAMLPLFLETGTMGAKRRRVVDGGENISLGKNVRKSFQNQFGTAVFFQVVVD